MRVGLFFGSYNPVHTGHMVIANYMANCTDLHQVWMVVSPHNPFKKRSNLANDYDRLHLVNLAIGENPRLRSSNLEFNLPKPSYTIDTLTYLAEKYPEHQFVLIMGGDNLATIEKWKNFDRILNEYDIYVYKRSGDGAPQERYTRVTYFDDVPLLQISSTYIRDQIKQERSIQYLVPDAVFSYLENSTMYKQRGEKT